MINWKQGFDSKEITCKEGFKEKVDEMIDHWAHNLSRNGSGGKKQVQFNDAADSGFQRESTKHESDMGELQSSSELKRKLESTLASNDHLTREVDSLVKEHSAIQEELSSKLKLMSEQLSQHRTTSAAEKDAHLNRISQLETDNYELQEEVRNLREELHSTERRAEDVKQQLQSQLEGTKQLYTKIYGEG